MNRYLVFVTAAVLTTPLAAAAQEGSLELDLGVSYALPPGGGFGEATGYLNGGLRLAGLFSGSGFGHIGGYGGLSLSESGSSWAAIVAGGGFLAPVSRAVSLGFSLTGEAFTVGSPFPYRAATLRAEPELVLTLGGPILRLRGYGGVGTSEVTVTREFIRDTRWGPIPVQVAVDLVSDLWAWGGGLEMQYPFGNVMPIVALEAYEAPQGTYAGGRMGLQVQLGDAAIRVEGGAWDTPDGVDGMIVAGLEVLVGDGSLFIADGGRYGPDPLLDTPVAAAAAAGYTQRLARLVPQPETTYEVLTAGQATTVRLELRSRDALTVAVAGDLTQWQEVPMVRGADGWVVELPVEPGAYHYGFLVDGAWYVPPDAPGRVEDDWGGVHATLIVERSIEDVEM